MRISDWSSDVCSSDLQDPGRAGRGASRRRPPAVGAAHAGHERAGHAPALFALRWPTSEAASGSRPSIPRQRMTGMADFWRRLRQRKLVQWALAYAAGAFALLQRSEEHTSELQSL